MSPKTWVDKFFNVSENIIYVVVGILLFVVSLFLIYDITISFFHPAQPGDFTRWIVEIIDKILLILMVVEIFYTVHVSFKEHSLHPEPFLIVGLIAAIRRILVISVESAYMPEKFNHHMIEMSILGVLIFLFVISLILIYKYTLHKPKS